MTWQNIVMPILLAIGVGVELLCCLGILVMDDVYDRLHYLGPAAVLGPIIIAAAVLIEESLSMAGIYTLLVAAALVVPGPVLTHAVARAARTRALGQWEARPDERIEEI